MIKLPINRVIRLVYVVFFCAVMSACTDDEKVEPTFSSLWDNLFNGCGVNCHSPNASDGTELGPDMSIKANFRNNVISKSVSVDYPNWAGFKAGDCNNVDFITPGNANESTLAAALISSVSTTLSVNNNNCTTAYNAHEVINQTISDPEVRDALVNWINDGAQNN